MQSGKQVPSSGKRETRLCSRNAARILRLFDHYSDVSRTYPKVGKMNGTQACGPAFRQARLRGIIRRGSRGDWGGQVF
jgi:hypothetical protein